MAAVDTDYHQRDLYEHIEAGEFPSWTLNMQIMPFEDAKTYRFNPFDLTKVWPHGDYPLHRGRPADPEPQRHRLPHRDGAGGVRAEQPGRRHRAVAGQDAAGPRVLLLRRAPRPARRELQADPGERPAGRRCTATPRTAPCGSATSPTRSTRRTPTAARRPTRRAPTTAAPGTPTATWCAPPTRCAPRTTTGARPARWSARCSTTPRATGWSDNIVGHLLNGGQRAGPAARLRVLAQRGQGPRRPDRGRRARQAGREGPQGRRSRPTRPGSMQAKA